jgi:hypothetical protein
MMQIGSFSGRLARPLNKLTSSFRWMGCIVAVYDYTSPREGGMKVRKNPGRYRGRNRRGCRSTRGGSKRRAMAGAAPRNPGPTPSTKRVGSSRGARYALRRINYSRILISYFKKLSEERVQVKDILRRRLNSSRQYETDIHQRLRKLDATRKRIRRSWLDLARSSGDSSEFLLERFRLLVQGDNGFPIRGNYWLRQSLERDWYGELVLADEGNPSENLEEEEAKLALSWCLRCNRGTNARFCRLCGAELTPPTRRRKVEKRQVVAKAPRPRVEQPPVAGDRKEIRPSGRGKRFPCPGCRRLFEAADGHSIKRCKARNGIS